MLSSLGTYDFTDYSELLTKVEETDAKVSELGSKVDTNSVNLAVLSKNTLGEAEYTINNIKNGSINNSGNSSAINTPMIPISYEDTIELLFDRPSVAQHYCFGWRIYKEDGTTIENIDVAANRISSKMFIRFEEAAYIRYAISESDGVSTYNPIRVSDFSENPIKAYIIKGYNLIQSRIVNLVSISAGSPSDIKDGESYFNVSTNKIRKCISVVEDKFITIPCKLDAVYIYGDYLYRWNGQTLVKNCRIDEIINAINNGSIDNYGNGYRLAKLGESIKTPFLELPECGSFDVWEPENTTSDYVTPNDRSQVTCSLTYQQFLDTYFNPYVGRLSDGYVVNRKSLGYDESGLYEIFEYDFIPKKYNRTVLLSAGMNALELSPIFGIAYFLKSLFDKTIDEPGLRYIYENVRLKIIPILCPYSFSQEKLLYANINGVNINRNFNYNNQWGSIQSTQGTWNYKGSEPESETETKVLKKWMIDNSKEADCYIDCHSDVGATNDPATFYTMVGDMATHEKLLAAQNKIKAYYTSKGLNPTSPSISVWTDGLNYPKIPYAQNVCGMTSIMIEQYPSDTSHGGTGLHNEDADIKNFVMMIRLYMLSLLRREKVVISDEDSKMMLYQLHRSIFGKSIMERDSLYSFGGFDNSGVSNDATNRMHTDYIEVNGGDFFYIRFDDTKNIRTVEIAQYDETKKLVDLSFTVATERTLTLESNTRYVRCSIKEVNNADMTELVKLDRTNSLICVGYKDIASDYELKKYDNASKAYVGDVKRLLTPTTDASGICYVKSNNELYSLIDIIAVDADGNPIGLLEKTSYKGGYIVNTSGASYIRCTMSRSGNTYIRLFELWENDAVSVYNVNEFLSDYGL